MTKVTLNFTEKLVYERTVNVVLPEGMSEGKLEALLDGIEQQLGIAMSLSNYLHVLSRAGVEVEAYDEDLSSPDRQEVECTEFVVED